MRRLTFIALVGAIGLAAASCTSEDTSAPITTSPVPVPSPQASPTAQPFSKPLVTQKPAAGGPTVPGLLKSTNPNERAKQVQSNIKNEKGQIQRTLKTGKDPFASAPLTIAANPQPTPTSASPTTSQSQSVPSLPNTASPQVGTPLPPPIDVGSGGSSRQVGNAPRPPRPSSPFPPNARARSTNPTARRPARSPLPSVPQVAGRPNAPRPVSPGSSVPSPGSPLPIGTPGSPGGGAIAQIPEPPSTAVASNIEVSGVVQVGNEVQAIVKAPNEPASRYVRPGQRIANGQVLVKRIEMSAGAEPIVILEENGVEVARAVGEAGASQTTT